MVLIILSCGNKANVTIQEIEEGQKLVSIDASWFGIEDNYEGRFEVDYIPLETNEKALIGVIDDLKVIGDRVFIFDRDVAKALFIYNINGMYVNKITATGMGPEELNHLRDFTINQESGEIIVNDLGLRRVATYDFNGKLIRVEKNELWFTAMEWLYGDTYLYYLSHYSVDENGGEFGPLVVFGDINGKVRAEFFNIDNRPSYLTVIEQFAMSHNGNEILYTKKFDDTIYTLNDEGELISRINVDFGNFGIEKDYREMKVESYMKYEMKNPFAQVKNAFSTDSHYVIGYANPVAVPFRHLHMQAIFSKDGSYSYLFGSNDTPDKDGVMLPSINSSDDEFFYGFHDAEDFFRANANNDMVISENFPGLNFFVIEDATNPILVRIKVKDEK